MRHFPLATILLSALVAISSLNAGPTIATPTDAEFLAAKAAFDRGDRAKLEVLAPRNSGHVLEPYVDAFDLFDAVVLS